MGRKLRLDRNNGHGPLVFFIGQTRHFGSHVCNPGSDPSWPVTTGSLLPATSCRVQNTPVSSLSFLGLIDVTHESLDWDVPDGLLEEEARKAVSRYGAHGGQDEEEAAEARGVARVLVPHVLP